MGRAVRRSGDCAIFGHAVRIRVLLNFNDVVTADSSTRAGLVICINVLLSHTSAQFWPGAIEKWPTRVN